MTIQTSINRIEKITGLSLTEILNQKVFDSWLNYNNKKGDRKKEAIEFNNIVNSACEKSKNYLDKNDLTFIKQDVDFIFRKNVNK